MQNKTTNLYLGVIYNREKIDYGEENMEHPAVAWSVGLIVMGIMYRVAGVEEAQRMNNKNSSPFPISKFVHSKARGG